VASKIPRKPFLSPVNSKSFSGSGCAVSEYTRSGTTFLTVLRLRDPKTALSSLSSGDSFFVGDDAAAREGDACLRSREDEATVVRNVRSEPVAESGSFAPV
jgi:hypothetical protein